jgi:endonuclease/exonuclease/phosphatase family metal-dependent hydrolase
LSYSHNGQWTEFGNATGALKGTSIQWRAHSLLPSPTQAEQHMPRSVGEAYQEKAVRVLTCHLEYFCEQHRRAQVQQIEAIVAVAKNLQQYPSKATEGLYKPRALPIDTIVCGDFNIADSTEQYQQLFASKRHWRDLAANNPQPTCGIFDIKQWKHGADRRDYFFTNNYALGADVETDVQTTLSDHQPIGLNIENL